LVGEKYSTGLGTDGLSGTMSKDCAGNMLGIYRIGFGRLVSSCPSNYVNMGITLDRTKISVGQTIPIADGALAVTIGDQPCAQWAGGTFTLISDLPDWSLAINATCSTPGRTLQVVGTFSGSE
jgi:hypothetical protein